MAITIIDPDVVTSWQNIVTGFERRLRDIVIPPDINPGTAKPLIARLDALYTDVMLLYPAIKTDDDNINQLISLVTKIEGADGSNPDKRAAKAIAAAQKYTVEDEVYNLYDLKQITNERLLYINSFIKILEGKQSRMITASGLMKIESNF